MWLNAASVNAATATKTQIIGFGDAAGGAAAVATFTSVGGTTDSATIAVNNAGKTTAYTSIAVAGIENLTVKAAGTNKLGNLIAAAAETIAFTGDGSVNATLLPGATVLKSVDASALKGGATLLLTDAQFGTNEIKVTGGAGNDSISFTDALGAKATINLGEGKNSLTITQGATALTAGSTFAAGSGSSDTLVLDTTTTAIDATSGKMFTGFENIKLAGTTSSYKVGDVAGITGYEVATSTAGTLTNLADAANVKIGASGTTVTLTLADNSDATSSVKATLSNGASTAAANGIVVTNLVTNAHVLNVESAGLVNATHNKITLSGDSLGQITNVKISGAQAFDLVTGAATALTLIDGSSATGALDISAASAEKSMTIKGGSANDTIAASNEAGVVSTITGGKGADIITLGSTAANNAGDVINVATAGDSTTTAYDKVSNFNAAAANADILKLGSTTLLSGTATDVLGTGWSLATGVASKGGATLADFIAAYSTSTTAGVVAFVVGGNTYVGYSDGLADATNDVLVELTGVAGITALATVAAANTVLIA